jgi:hypothetical protein
MPYFRAWGYHNLLSLMEVVLKAGRNDRGGFQIALLQHREEGQSPSPRQTAPMCLPGEGLR